MYEFPAIHSFPPFYTKQSNATVLQKQLDEWASLILHFCQEHRIYSVLPLGAVLKQSGPDPEKPPNFFENSRIERAADAAFRSDIWRHVVHLGRGSYVNGKTPDAGILVYWRTVPEWAELLYSCIEETGQQGAVLTVYEMTRLEDSVVHADFLDMDAVLFERVLDELRRQGRALVIRENGEIAGVKFV